jgi:hypothetical protein
LAVTDQGESPAFVLLFKDEQSFKPTIDAMPPGLMKYPRLGNGNSMYKQRNQDDDRNRNAQEVQE